MNLIVGATGSLGSRICRELAERGQSVRALVRSTSDPAKLQELRSLGAHVVYGDLTDAASLRTACEGVDVVVSSATVIKSAEPTFSAVDDAGQRALVDAARARDVG
ncbi:MAG: SDR family NAD(P)-dependent oxidoreductase, partial [Gemmatimonadota bacterium]